jgi:hypothetical protein
MTNECTGLGDFNDVSLKVISPVLDYIFELFF